MLGIYNYIITIMLMMIGVYITVISRNLVKKLIGLSVFQTSILLFYISLAYVTDGIPPLIEESMPNVLYHNPIPHVLMLTAIVVGISTTVVGLSMVVKIKKQTNSIEETEL